MLTFLLVTVGIACGFALLECGCHRYRRWRMMERLRLQDLEHAKPASSTAAAVNGVVGAFRHLATIGASQRSPHRSPQRDGSTRV